MNYQFFGTAGIITAILVVLCLIFHALSEIREDESFDCLCLICAGIAVLFWVIIGIICGLNAVWGWGLVK